MMTRQQIETVMALCQEFRKYGLDALQQLDDECAEKHVLFPERFDGEPDSGDHSHGSAATAALRRRSMDLTRALALLRRSGCARQWGEESVQDAHRAGDEEAKP